MKATTSNTTSASGAMTIGLRTPPRAGAAFAAGSASGALSSRGASVNSASTISASTSGGEGSGFGSSAFGV
ncbi:MAG: hypothetical protein R3C54_16170 [Parvularculaceae bacterium]